MKTLQGGWDKAVLWTLEAQDCWRVSLAASERCGYCTGQPVDLNHAFHSGGAGTVWSRIHTFRKKSTGVGDLGFSLATDKARWGPWGGWWQTQPLGWTNVSLFCAQPLWLQRGHPVPDCYIPMWSITFFPSLDSVGAPQFSLLLI